MPVTEPAGAGPTRRTRRLRNGSTVRVLPAALPRWTNRGWATPDIRRGPSSVSRTDDRQQSAPLRELIARHWRRVRTSRLLLGDRLRLEDAAGRGPVCRGSDRGDVARTPHLFGEHVV